MLNLKIFDRLFDRSLVGYSPGPKPPYTLNLVVSNILRPHQNRPISCCLSLNPISPFLLYFIFPNPRPNIVIFWTCWLIFKPVHLSLLPFQILAFATAQAQTTIDPRTLTSMYKRYPWPLGLYFTACLN